METRDPATKTVTAHSKILAEMSHNNIIMLIHPNCHWLRAIAVNVKVVTLTGAIWKLFVHFYVF